MGCRWHLRFLLLSYDESCRHVRVGNVHSLSTFWDVSGMWLYEHCYGCWKRMWSNLKTLFSRKFILCLRNNGSSCMCSVALDIPHNTPFLPVHWLDLTGWVRSWIINYLYLYKQKYVDRIKLLLCIIFTLNFTTLLVNVCTFVNFITITHDFFTSHAKYARSIQMKPE